MSLEEEIQILSANALFSILLEVSCLLSVIFLICLMFIPLRKIEIKARELWPFDISNSYIREKNLAFHNMIAVAFLLAIDAFHKMGLWAHGCLLIQMMMILRGQKKWITRE